ncbi:ribosomal-protein-alanine N-acetyltransferase [Roseibium hamelinense]|uniref:Ribosomal-protein-alanine N-acetyltransferase n=1 Tax=Roseibium hamelinense TaxID=150831 RepID=A0A562T115_9HYPH|nr:ribosomal protein S18-alanine N-acetyltransferase [Roseibium hamelinense]MTI44676.1 ribosomal-protein-alanine N-acetyltransferase [Roseibium hamelinense]TWI87305.1 ribosomal-protein-alanine N-acetyltransferase [Roseibium hamelinense]
MTFWWFWAAAPVVEKARDEDLTDIAEIHRKSFPHGWEPDELARMMNQEGTSILVARRSSPYGTQSCLGFLITRVAGDEAEVITIAIDPRHRGRGIAKKLMQDGMFRLYGERCASLFLEVDSSNEPALLLYRSLGFRQVGERKGYYRGSAGDGTALVMRVDLR